MINRSHSQDGPWSWLICFCASISAAIVPGFAFSFGVLLPHLMKHFSSDRQSTAWLGSLALALMTSIGFLSAMLCDRLGCRCVTITGSLLCIISLVTSSFANHLTPLYFTYGILFGIGNSFVFTAGLLITPQYFTKWRSFAISIVAGGMGAGILAMGPTIQELVDSLGWRRALRVMVGPTGLVAVLGLSFRENNRNKILPNNEKHSSHQVINEEKSNDSGATVELQSFPCQTINESHEANISVAAEEKMERGKNPTKHQRNQRKKKLINCSVWRIPLYTIITCSCILAFLAEYTPQIHLIKYTEELNISQDKAARLYIYMGIATFLSRPLVGALCSIKPIKPQYIYQLALFGNGISTLLLPSVTDYPGLIAYVVVYGFCDGAYLTMLNVLILGSLDDERRASGFGMETCLASVTTLIGPPLAGLIADRCGSYVPAFYVGGAVSIAAGVVVFLLICCKTDEAATETTDNINQCS